jgi:flagellar biogenesis protein FliO
MFLPCLLSFLFGLIVVLIYHIHSLESKFDLIIKQHQNIKDLTSDIIALRERIFEIRNLCDETRIPIAGKIVLIKGICDE